ncbi:PiggyBac transposable element-derived protein 3 [Trichinella pseudospiralis]|uniref:PiggyBac transposable element-derived protein 3 n=1 Tax=Trichinella pseudospiralis TaxID=6337 RepID=A0A0V1G361_TRIPS|nr:PiggyBac transposable element-derived protein 3 [Trichinella pseudospiralis]
MMPRHARSKRCPGQPNAPDHYVPKPEKGQRPRDENQDSQETATGRTAAPAWCHSQSGGAAQDRVLGDSNRGLDEEKVPLETGGVHEGRALHDGDRPRGTSREKGHRKGNCQQNSVGTGQHLLALENSHSRQSRGRTPWTAPSRGARSAAQPDAAVQEKAPANVSAPDSEPEDGTSNRVATGLSPVGVHCSATVRTSGVLPVVRAMAYGDNGRKRTVNCLLDSGSERSLIRAEIANELGLRGTPSSTVRGVQGLSASGSKDRLGAHPGADSFAALSPFVDTEGLLRVRGRLSQTTLPWCHRHPLLLPHDGRVVELIVRRAYESELHAGLNQTLAALRLRFWVLDDRPFCPMSELPSERATPSFPFRVGLDFAGSLHVKDSEHLQNVYICLFTCMVTRAVHLEMVMDMTTISFLAAFLRFIARRGRPSCFIVATSNTILVQRKRRRLWPLQNHVRNVVLPPTAGDSGGDDTDQEYLPDDPEDEFDPAGYNCQPEAKHYYWSTQPDMDAQGAISCISSSRFMEIKKYLYLADNQKLVKDDKMSKLCTNCSTPALSIKHGMFHEKLSVDESIVPYYGRHAAKLFLKGKSIRFGYKVWLLCGNDGYP